MERATDGVLVLDQHGTPRFASGMGLDAGIAAALQRRWSRRNQVPLKRLEVVEGDGSALTVAAIPSEDSVCFLVFAAQDADELSEFLASVDAAPDILRHFVTDPYKALVVVDQAARIAYMSSIHEKFFGLQRGDSFGKHVTEVIENTKLQEVVATGRGQVAQLHEMNGVTRVVSRLPIFDREQRLVAAIGQVMFKGPETLQQLSTELAQVKKERDFYQRELSGMRNRSFGLSQIVGSSDAVRKLKADIVRVARLDVPVLLTGESGTGKEMVAHAIHLLSPRSENPLVLVNSAAMPATLVESELFGYAPGAFTGADRKGRKGKFDAAHTGTMFLDEIGDMPMEMQVKLLRVLQDGHFERVGSDKVCHSDFRLISASNRDFGAMIFEGAFRQDLFYRVCTVTLRLPPLQERTEDIPALVDTFLDAFALRHGTPRQQVSKAAMQYLQSRSWPGNIRQLQHAVERAAIFCDGATLEVASFEELDAMEPSADTTLPPVALEAVQRPGGVRGAQAQLETELIAQAMQRTGGNKKRVAETLGISRSYLYKRLASMEHAALGESASASQS